MDIGPIAGIRPVPMVNRFRSADDLSAVFSVEFRKQEQDETYTPSHQKASRGLEDEDEDTLIDGEETYSAGSGMMSGGSKISFFA